MIASCTLYDLIIVIIEINISFCLFAVVTLTMLMYVD